MMEIYPDIPTAMTKDEADFLYSLAKSTVRGITYEAGALLGYSTVILAHSSSLVISCDKHEGYPTYNARPTLEPFVCNLKRHKVRNKVLIMQHDFRDVPVPIACEFAFGDLTGEFNITKEFLTWTHDVPLVAVHDYERNGCSGVASAVCEYLFTGDITHARIKRVGTVLAIDKRSYVYDMWRKQL